MRVAIDTGGTFTDCLFLRDDRLEILKLPSTPGNPAKAIANALAEIRSRTSRDEWTELDLLCGTTVGTNALLERRGGRVALVTTAGFEDVLEIGRQARPRLYDLFVKKSEPLVPQSRRFGLAERLDSNGRVLLSPSRREIARVVRAVAQSVVESGAGSAWSPPERGAGSAWSPPERGTGSAWSPPERGTGSAWSPPERGTGSAWSPPESIAVCLLFSFVNPAH